MKMASQTHLHPRIKYGAGSGLPLEGDGNCNVMDLTTYEGIFR